MAHVFLVTKCFVSESVSTEQMPAELRTPLYEVLATPLQWLHPTRDLLRRQAL